MADNRKNGFKTLETDVGELHEKIRKHRLKVLKIIIAIVGIIVLIGAAILLILRLKQYTDYQVQSSTERSDTAATKFEDFQGGIIKYGNDGAFYTDDANDLIWNQTYEMQNPQMDICEDYVAFSDKGGTQIYILDASGLQGRIETTMSIVKVCVANQGTVAVLMEKEGTGYIQLYDKNGEELANGELHVENSGYPLDIALSNDAVKLAVSMLDVNEGTVKSMIVFYNFGSVGQNEIDNIVATYSYSDIVIPEIEFVTNNRMLAFADTEVMVFEGTQKPSVSKEITVEKEIKSVFYNADYFGIVYNNEDEDNTRHMEIYDTKGSHVLSKDFDMDYDTIEFLENNQICILNTNECMIYNTYGVQHFRYNFDVPIYKVIAGTTERNYTFLLEGTTEKVKLK